ncbi:[protein-PII] uridylyltransferase [Solicola gregarius]|uniref:Bifunctional uridylyltransferase/uridylyl-removing enzyme n=1 Tax=Solicola gregarius TaxID=2908642 RepID=A0AA46YJJ1_9ACTN|nr:[protein-PII] uridylyltransferase [Solicola gregarius]
MRELFDAAATSAGLSPENGCGLALVAVGGYGRSELSPASDVDVVLLHDPRMPSETVAAAAEKVWYPLWDDGVLLDHAVRSTSAMHDAAVVDVRTATGMLDARGVAGDISLVQSLRSSVLAAWRRDARTRLPELRAACNARIDRAGWLAHAAVPDLKDSGGGLRDGVVMRALVSTWLIDVPRHETEPLRRSLLDVRDALHEVTGRRTDRLSRDLMPDVAAALELEADALDLHVRGLGWRTAHLAQLAWRRIDGVLRPHAKRTRSPTGPKIIRLDQGVGLLEGEVVLTRDARPSRDPDLPLRAAVAAATRRHILAPSVAARCARDGLVASTPWQRTTRDLMVGLLASGPELVPVWEELDIAGVVDGWLPEWGAIRLRGSSSPVHTYTIDRHSVQTAVNASGLVRQVRRPDLLVVAALLHDIGKGQRGDHSVVGAPIARDIALRWGFSATDADRVATLVRRHLLLPTAATRRDIEDPATAERIAEIIGDRETLDLLAALTEADATATGPTAWTSWRAGLVRGLVRKTHEVLDASTVSPDPEEYSGWEFDPVALDGRPVVVRRIDHHAGALLSIVAPDRPGLLAELAAGMALAGLRVRSARTGGDDVASTLWEVAGDDVDIGRLEPLLRRVLDGQVDVADRLGYAADPDRPVPVVTVLRDQSATSSLVEVRADDDRGLLWVCCRVIAGQGHTIRSTHATTIGPQADNVFYVVGGDGEPLDDEAMESLATGLRTALGGG